MSLITDMERTEVTLQSSRMIDAPLDELITFEPQALLAEQAPLALEPGAIQVWSFNLEGSADLVARCRDWLSPQEQHRADRFVFERDRTRHTVAHGVLRHLLGRYCGVGPASLRFVATTAGKPALLHHEGVCFNLTHSENRALLGLSTGRELGIDLERVRSNLEALAISRHYFFGAERDAIEAAPAAERDNAFFRYWVAKEAVLKAQGIGLGFPLDRFRVDFHPDGATACIETFDPGALAPDWTVKMLRCPVGWLGAVAARGIDWGVKVVTDPSQL